MNNHINEKNLTSFVGSVPVPMEMSMVGLFLGGPIQYRVDKNTGLDEVCLQIPKKNGTYQPIIVTLGRADSIAPDARIALYHACGLDSVVNGSSNTYEAFVDRFTSVFDMSSKNDYVTRFYEPNAMGLREKLLKQYPENIKTFDDAVEQFKNAYENGNEKVQESTSASEKKGK